MVSGRSNPERNQDNCDRNGRRFDIRIASSEAVPLKTPARLDESDEAVAQIPIDTAGRRAMCELGPMENALSRSTAAVVTEMEVHTLILHRPLSEEP